MHEPSSATAAEPSSELRSPPPSLLDRVGSGTLAVDLSLVSLVVLVLGVIRLGTPSFWVDEAFTAERTEQPYTELIEGYHWLYQTIVNTWTLAAGTSEWALRFPSVLGAMLACGLLVVLARMLFPRLVGLLAGLLLATSPFLVKWSQQARGYTFVAALAVLATVLLLRALQRGSRGAWALYGLAFAAVVVWHPVAGFVLLPSHVVLMAQRRERLMPHALLAALIVLALGVTWAAQLLERSTGEGPQGLGWLKAPSAEGAARTLVDVSGAAGLGVVLAVGGLVVLWRAGRGDVSLWLGAWAFGPFVMTLLAVPLKPLYLDRYLVTAAPAFALLGGILLAYLGSKLRLVAVASVALVSAIGLVHWYSQADPGGNWRGEDWRGAVRSVLERRAPDEPVLVVPWSVRQAATYYGATDAVATSTEPSVWVVFWSETEGEPTGVELSILRFGGRQLVQREDFGKRVSIQHWQREE